MSTSPLRSRFLVLVLASLLPACATNSNHSVRAPTPPVVDCEQGTIVRPIPPLPASFVDAVGYLSNEASDWIADVLGIVEQERATDRAESECYRRLRKTGVIR